MHAKCLTQRLINHKQSVNGNFNCDGELSELGPRWYQPVERDKARLHPAHPRGWGSLCPTFRLHRSGGQSANPGACTDVQVAQRKATFWVNWWPCWNSKRWELGERPQAVSEDRRWAQPSVKRMTRARRALREPARWAETQLVRSVSPRELRTERGKVHQTCC